MTKTSRKNRGPQILFSFLIIAVLLTSAAFAAYRLGGSDAPTLDYWGYLENGDRSVIEFKILDQSKEAKIVFQIGRKAKYNGSVSLQKYGERWWVNYVPVGSFGEARKFALEPEIKTDGVNLLEIKKDNDWVSFTLNGKEIISFPALRKNTVILCSAFGIELEYRWKEKKFREKSDAENVSVEGGRFIESRPFHRLYDGDTVRMTFKPMQVSRSSRWMSSIVIYVDSTSLWLNDVDNEFAVELQDDRGKSQQYPEPIPIKKGWNNVDVTRTGNVLRFSLNGKFLFKTVHHPDMLFGDGWYIHRKVVGYSIMANTEKTKTISNKPGKHNEWSKTVKKKNPEVEEAEKDMKILDGQGVQVRHYTDKLITLKDGQSVTVYFKVLKGYMEPRKAPSSPQSCVVGLGVDHVWYFNLTKIQGLPAYLIDPYNVQYFNQMIPIPIKKGISSIGLKRKGNKLNLYYNGEYVESVRNPSAGSPRENWDIKFRVAGMRVKYRVKLNNIP